MSDNNEPGPETDIGNPIEPAPTANKKGNLTRRILSSIVILPIAVIALQQGGHVFNGLLIVIAALMGWEWANLVVRDDESLMAGGMNRRICFFASLVVVAVCLYGLLVDPTLAAGSAVGLALLMILVSVLRNSSRLVWLAAGLPAVCLPVISAGWLRAQDSAPVETLYWMIGLVVLTDIGGYVFGRSIGGPKLAPRLSPNKTWAGLLGGMACAGIFGAGLGFYSGGVNPISLGVLSAGLAAVAQIGDLMESAVKRRFNAKDSGSIIPGHGGVLDRVDGQITVAPLVAAMVALTGISPLIW